LEWSTLTKQVVGPVPRVDEIKSRFRVVHHINLDVAGPTLRLGVFDAFAGYANT